ncbi:MAG: hypothetical protein ABIJ14_00295 [Nanoarchaeota archaeon]|nr:hypothetical protein [Nanoarchaeota archaeon]
MERLSVEEEKRLIELIHKGYHFLDKNDNNDEGWIVTPFRKKYSVEELLEIKSQKLEFGNREQIEKIKALEF